MPKVEMKGFTVTNVEACPKCGAEEWAYTNDYWRFFQMNCGKCDYQAPGSLMLYGANNDKNPKAYKEQTRALFNHWNEEVAKVQNKEPKKVRLIKNHL